MMTSRLNIEMQTASNCVGFGSSSGHSPSITSPNGAISHTPPFGGPVPSARSSNWLPNIKACGDAIHRWILARARRRTRMAYNYHSNTNHRPPNSARSWRLIDGECLSNGLVAFLFGITGPMVILIAVSEVGRLDLAFVSKREARASQHRTGVSYLGWILT